MLKPCKWNTVKINETHNINMQMKQCKWNTQTLKEMCHGASVLAPIIRNANKKVEEKKVAILALVFMRDP